jgi:hypothetical protein
MRPSAGALRIGCLRPEAEYQSRSGMQCNMSLPVLVAAAAAAAEL